MTSFTEIAAYCFDGERICKIIWHLANGKLLHADATTKDPVFCDAL